MDASAQPDLHFDAHFDAISQSVLARVGYKDHTVLNDLLFLYAWEAGLVPCLSGALRARQIYRANPLPAAPANSRDIGLWR